MLHLVEVTDVPKDKGLQLCITLLLIEAKIFNTKTTFLKINK